MPKASSMRVTLQRFCVSGRSKLCILDLTCMTLSALQEILAHLGILQDVVCCMQSLRGAMHLFDLLGVCPCMTPS